MPRYAAFLRAINVGGTGKLAMSDLKRLCESCGFTEVATYIQSGNVAFTTKQNVEKTQAALAAALERVMKKPVGTFVRSHAELRAIDRANPFADADPKRVIVVFLDDEPSKKALADTRTPGGEELVLHTREVFIHYPNGQGTSQLKTSFTSLGTGRNLNTVRKLMEMTGA